MFKKAAVLFTTVFVFAASVSSTIAQVEEVAIAVDGLACPFCSYGLEKKLKKVPGVDEIKIFVEDGRAVLKHKKDGSIKFEDVAAAVKDAGFTPGEINATIVGMIGQEAGKPVVNVSESAAMLLLEENDKLANLRAELQAAPERVRLTGGLAKESPEGHYGHPYTLTVEEFEVLK